MSSQQPNNYQIRRSSTIGTAGAGIPVAPIPTESMDMNNYILDNRPQQDIVHSTSAHLDVGNLPFDSFGFPYQHGLQVDTAMGNQLEQYHQSGPHSDHRSSITSNSAVPRASFSSAVGSGRGRNTSMSGGSEDASPSSHHASGGGDGGYGDDFGLGGGGPVDGSDLGGRMREEKNDPTPPWSELKTKAGKERKRLPLACIACRRKKIRCSGEKPACKHCLRSRIPCVYKVTTRKAAPRTDYMAMLDKRLKRMEERIIKIVPKEEQDSTVSVTRATVKPAIPGTVPTQSSTSKKRVADEAFGHELDNWSKSAANPNIETNTRPPSLMIQEAEEGKLLVEGAEALPSSDIQEHLSEIFFENLYGQTYHILHKPSFMKKLKAGSLPPVLILAVCAISARFSTHPKLNTTPAFLRGEDWASVAREIVMRRYEWPNITILTCLIILGLHEFGTCQGGRSWALGGQAIRMAYALQLHRDLDYDPLKRNGTTPLSFIDREIRRRTMWACFQMDRFNSSGTERPTFIKEENMKIALPIKEKYFLLDMPGPTENLRGEVQQSSSPIVGGMSNPKENMGVTAHMIRAIALWGRIINYLNLGGKDEDKYVMWHPESVYADLIRQAETFTDSLPTSLKYTPENLHTHETESLANQFLFLHISIQQNMLFMNRFAVPGHPGGREDAPKEFFTKAGAKAFEAANRISELLRDSEAYFVTAPFTGYCAFLSSTVHIFGIFSNNSAMEAASKKNLATNVKFLAKMKRYWGMFHFMSENLKDQYRTYADASRGGTGGSKPSAQIFQYGDWFDQYPHGVSQSDFEDPAVQIKKEKGDDAVLGQKADYHTVEEFFNTISTVPQQETGPKAPKRKAKRKPSLRQEQLDPFNKEVQQNHPGQANHSISMHSNNPQPPQIYNQMSPTTPVDMYNQQSYYSNDVLLPPHQQGILPQLDRQLVFSAYAGIDQSHLNSQGLADPTNSWDMQMNGMTGYVAEQSSAWFMPFNMQPPEIGQDSDNIFNAAMGAADAGYGIHNGNGMGGN